MLITIVTIVGFVSLAAMAFLINFNINYLKRVAKFHNLPYQEAKKLFESDPENFQQMYVEPFREAVRSGKESVSIFNAKEVPAEVERSKLNQDIENKKQYLSELIERNEYENFRRSFPEVLINEKQFLFWHERRSDALLKAIFLNSYKIAALAVAENKLLDDLEKNVADRVVEFVNVFAAARMKKDQFDKNEIVSITALLTTTSAQFAQLDPRKVSQLVKSGLGIKSVA